MTYLERFLVHVQKRCENGSKYAPGHNAVDAIQVLDWLLGVSDSHLANDSTVETYSRAFLGKNGVPTGESTHVFVRQVEGGRVVSVFNPSRPLTTPKGTGAWNVGTMFYSPNGENIDKIIGGRLRLTVRKWLRRGRRSDSVSRKALMLSRRCSLGLRMIAGILVEQGSQLLLAVQSRRWQCRGLILGFKFGV